MVLLYIYLENQIGKPVWDTNISVEITSKLAHK